MHALLAVPLSLALMGVTDPDPFGPELSDTPEGAVPIGVDAADMPVISPDGPRPQRLGAKIIYIDFDGARGPGGVNILPFDGGKPLEAAMIQAVRKKMADFGVTVTDVRPTGDHDTEVVGDWEGQDPDFAGVAPGLDCFDRGGGGVSYTVGMHARSADSGSEIMLQELAHTWGMEHVSEIKDLLYPTTQGSGKTFRDECLEIVTDTEFTPHPNPSGQCASQHREACPSGGQNSYADLLSLFGPSIADTESPEVVIVEPDDGDTFDVSDGDAVELIIAMRDNEVPAVIDTQITIDSDALNEPIEQFNNLHSPDQHVFPLNGLPNGTYTVSVDIADESGNEAASTSISFTVTGSEAEAPPASEDSGEGDGDEGDGDDDGGTGDEGGGTKRGCRSGAPGTGLAAFAFLALLRRRRASAHVR